MSVNTRRVAAGLLPRVRTPLAGRREPRPTSCTNCSTAPSRGAPGSNPRGTRARASSATGARRAGGCSGRTTWRGSVRCCAGARTRTPACVGRVRGRGNRRSSMCAEQREWAIPARAGEPLLLSAPFRIFRGYARIPLPLYQKDTVCIHDLFRRLLSPFVRPPVPVTRDMSGHTRAVDWAGIMHIFSDRANAWETVR